MTALKTKYAAVSQWMQKHHVRGIYLMIVLYVIVVALLNSSFLTVGNWVNLLRQVAVYGIVSCGITLIMLTGRTDRQATLKLLGGDLEILWDSDSDHVFMTGPADFVFDGDYPL